MVPTKHETTNLVFIKLLVIVHKQLEINANALIVKIDM